MCKSVIPELCFTVVTAACWSVTTTGTCSVMGSQHNSESQRRCCVWCDGEVKSVCEVNRGSGVTGWIACPHPHPAVLQVWWATDMDGVTDRVVATNRQKKQTRLRLILIKHGGKDNHTPCDKALHRKQKPQRFVSVFLFCFLLADRWVQSSMLM